jgi:hypothetical protein
MIWTGDRNIICESGPYPRWANDEFSDARSIVFNYSEDFEPCRYDIQANDGRLDRGNLIEPIDQTRMIGK